MDRLEAIELLENHIKFKRGKLPLIDEVIKLRTNYDNGEHIIEEYTFIFLIKCAYGL